MIRISVAEGPDYLDDLAGWLEQFSELAGQITAPEGRGEARHMGSVTDALVVAVGAGGSLTVLAKGLVSWAASYRRQRGIDVHVFVDNGHGDKLVVDVRNALNAESVLRQIMEQADQDKG